MKVVIMEEFIDITESFIIGLHMPIGLFFGWCRCAFDMIQDNGSMLS